MTNVGDFFSEKISEMHQRRYISKRELYFKLNIRELCGGYPVKQMVVQWVLRENVRWVPCE